jgi:hypothetical protein
LQLSLVRCSATKARKKGNPHRDCGYRVVPNIVIFFRTSFLKKEFWIQVLEVESRILDVESVILHADRPDLEFHF